MHGVNITVQIAARALEKPVRDLRQQAPFAVSRGLTWLAKDGREAARTGLDRHFHVRRAWVRNGVRFRPARKAAWPASFSVVGVEDDRAAFLEKHLTAGEKSPPRGRRAWAVPAAAMKGKSMRRGDPRWPGAMLKSGKATFVDLSGKARIAVAKVRGRGTGRHFVMQWFLPRTIRIKSAWRFHDDVDRAVAANWHRRMTESFRSALATAKGRR